MTPMNEGILDGIFFYFNFYDRKLSCAMRNSCTFPHCLTSGQYGSSGGLPLAVRQQAKKKNIDNRYDYTLHAMQNDKHNYNARTN